MTAAIQDRPSAPAPQLDLAMGEVSASAKEFTGALLARIGAEASILGRGPGILAKGRALKAQFQQFMTDFRPETGPYEHTLKAFGDIVSIWVKDLDSALSTMDEVERRYQSASRETRRASARVMAMARQIAQMVEELKALMLEFLESVDPTPDDYLEQEIRKAHGDRADSMISSFRELASSEAFTLEAFKKRHSLK